MGRRGSYWRQMPWRISPAHMGKDPALVIWAGPVWVSIPNGLIPRRLARRFELS